MREGEVGYGTGGWGVSKCSREGRGDRSNLARNRGQKECVFTVNFEFTFAQMCFSVPREVLVVSDPPAFFLSVFPLLTNTTQHTHSHKHTHLRNKMNSC